MVLSRKTWVHLANGRLVVMISATRSRCRGRAELEQQLGARFGERYEPELVDSARFFPLRTR